MKKQSTLLLIIGLFLNQLNAQCLFPTSQGILDFNKINMHLTTDGSVFGKKGSEVGGTEYPKLTAAQAQSGQIPTIVVFSGGLWVSGKNNGNLTLATSSFSTSNSSDYASGPIDLSSGTTSLNVCNYFDKISYLKKTDVDNFKSLISTTSVFPINTSLIHSSILEWPAKGNTRFHSNYSIKDPLAPFIDKNNNGTYEPEYGDCPIMKGDIAGFWVINDIGKSHTNVVSLPNGVEIQMMAYQFIDSPLDKTVFYDCKVIKKTEGNLTDFIFSLFVDPDLGCYTDDYVGCDTTKHYGFAYNADSFDANTNVPGFMSNPPVVATSFLSQSMNSFVRLSNMTGIQNGTPATDVEHRNIMEGKQKNGNNFTIGGDGFSGTVPTKFVFPGNPSDPTQWSMASAQIPLTDCRYVQSTAPSLLEYNKPKSYNFMLNIVNINPYTPTFNSSIVNSTLDSIKKYHDSFTKICITSLELITVQDSASVKKGSITINNVVNGTPPYQYTWSSGETSSAISGKASGDYFVTITDSKNCSYNTKITIANKTATGSIVYNSSKENFSIYPNPVDQEIHLINEKNIKIEEIKISDISGKIIKTLLDNEMINTHSISAKELTKGIYFIEIKAQDQVFYYKFIKI